jgi:molybdenum cofactor synthesis domain-containing protein
VLAEDVRAEENLPPFPSAGVDGYAVRSAEGDNLRRYQAEQVAGVWRGLRLEPGAAIRITTGAAIPVGADAVVMVEDTDERDGMIIFRTQPNAGDGIRPAGQDVHSGDVVLRQGCVLGAAEIGLLASVGQKAPLVRPRPKVALFSTGNELVEPGTPLLIGNIWDSNRYGLMEAVRMAGIEPISKGIARDQMTAVEDHVDSSLKAADAVISSGGVSMRQLDLVKPLLERRGQVHFGRVNTKPGKPYFALPGFPVSSLVSFEIFVRPALLKMAGRTDLLRPRLRVRLAHDVRHDPARTEFQRAVATSRNGEVLASTTGFQGSGRLLSLVGANVLLKLPHGTGDFAKGKEVEALAIGPIEYENCVN